jgi:hypothetical protein
MKICFGALIKAAKKDIEVTGFFKNICFENGLRLRQADDSSSWRRIGSGVCPIVCFLNIAFGEGYR